MKTNAEFKILIKINLMKEYINKSKILNISKISFLIKRYLLKCHLIKFTKEEQMEMNQSQKRMKLRDKKKNMVMI